MALATRSLDSGPAAVAVVCDGVSSTGYLMRRRLAAAQTAVKVLLARVRTGEDLIEASGTRSPPAGGRGRAGRAAGKQSVEGSAVCHVRVRGDDQRRPRPVLAG